MANVTIQTVRRRVRAAASDRRRTGTTHLPPGTLELTPEVLSELDVPLAVTPSEADVRQALAASASTVLAAERLGLPSRYALYRLMRKLGIEE